MFDTWREAAMKIGCQLIDTGWREARPPPIEATAEPNGGPFWDPGETAAQARSARGSPVYAPEGEVPRMKTAEKAVREQGTGLRCAAKPSFLDRLLEIINSGDWGFYRGGSGCGDTLRRRSHRRADPGSVPRTSYA